MKQIDRYQSYIPQDALDGHRIITALIEIGNARKMSAVMLHFLIHICEYRMTRSIDRLNIKL